MQREEAPSFAAFRKFVGEGSYQPSSWHRLETLFTMIVRYAKFNGFPLKQAHIVQSWTEMLSWRDWVSRNEARAQRMLNSSLEQFLWLAVTSIQGQSGQSGFLDFKGILIRYFKMVGRQYPPRTAAVLGAYLDLVERCGAPAPMGRVQDMLDGLRRRRYPPLRLAKVVDKIIKHICGPDLGL